MNIGGVVAALVLGLGPWSGPIGVVRAEVAAVDATEPGARVLVLPIATRGELPPDTATEMRGLVADNLADEGLEVLVEGAAVCADAACRQQAAQQTHADFVVGTEVVGDEDEFTVTVTLFAGDTGEALAPFEDACSICGFVEVRDMVRLRALDVRAEVVRRHREAAVVGPSGPIEPVVVVDPPVARSKLIAPGWSLVGAGAASTVGGVVLLVLHKRSAGCLENPRGGDCVPLRYTTAPAGAALLGAGVAVLVGGVVMVVLGRRAERRARDQRAQLRPRLDGLELRF